MRNYSIKSLDPVRRNIYLLLATFWLVALGVAVAAYQYYRNQRNAIESEGRTQLASIAELKIRQVQAWRNERMADARILAASPISPAVRKFLVDGRGTPGVRRQVTDWLQAVRAASGYANVILVNPKRRIWSAAGTTADDSELYFRLATRVVEKGDILLTDFHLDNSFPGPHMGLHVPLWSGKGLPPAGALLLSIDPKSFLYPLIQSWPTSSRSAETLLARREGDQVVYLNELRHRTGTALQLRLPLSAEKLPAARGAAGFEGILTGVDYRGVPVLAVTRRVPDTPWVLVAKIDLDEVHAPIERQTFWLGLIACSVILTIGIGVALILRDLRARLDVQQYRAELEQRALQGHYDYLSRFANDIILLTDEAAAIVEANDRAANSYGYSREELIGMPIRRLRAPETQAAFDQDWRKTEDQDSVIFETRHIRKDGSTFPVEVSARKVSADGEGVFRQSIIRDITERKEAEKERAKLQEQLQQAQRLESIGQLAGGVAHDFNNLLTVINGYSSMVMEALAAHDPLQDAVREIFDAGQRAARLTRQLLAFSRKQVISPKLLNLNMVVTDVVKMLRRLVGENITIVTEFEASLEPVFLDPGQMEQVLMNLAANARDAMPQGGKLLIETRNVAINEEYATLHVDARPGDYVLLAVSDTGEGMSQETLKHAFEPFFTTKPRGQGTGLGLATIYGIVKQSNGWIRVYSELGKGTTFQIHLPRMVAGQYSGTDADMQFLPGARDVRGTETVLVVEDQAEVRKLAVQALERYGYRVIQAPSGDEALALSGSIADEIHLLITDVVMTGITGPELAGRVASTRPRMKTLYMSGYTESLVAQQGVLDGGIAYLQKPFTAGVLAKKVREVLDNPGI